MTSTFIRPQKGRLVNRRLNSSRAYLSYYFFSSFSPFLTKPLIAPPTIQHTKAAKIEGLVGSKLKAGPANITMSPSTPRTAAIIPAIFLFISSHLLSLGLSMRVRSTHVKILNSELILPEVASASISAEISS